MSYVTRREVERRLKIVKTCPCGMSFTAEEWRALRLVGSMVDEVESLELRDCSCGSTIAIEMVT